MKLPLERVVVIGSSCSGKTTFAKRLAAILDYPHIELDALHWLPNWVERPVEDFRALSAEAVAADCWVLDGNYGKVRDVLWPRATCIVWLNYGFPTIWVRALRRTLRRAITREELYSGNRESLRMAFLDRDSILIWVITTFRRRRRTYEQLRATGTYPHVQWIEFRKPAEAEKWIREAVETFFVTPPLM